MNNWLKNVGLWVVIGLVLMMLFVQFSKSGSTRDVMSYSQMMVEAKAANLERVKQEGARTFRVWLRDNKGENKGEGKIVYTPGSADLYMWEDLRKSGAQLEPKVEEEPSILLNILISSFPVLLLIGVWIYFMRQMQGGGKGGAFSFGKSRAKMLDESTNPITFADVAGCDEAKEEVSELVDFLRDPSKFQKLGGRIPRGVLMVGSPGTGKTLLARGIAGEAKVPFFYLRL